MIYRQMANRLHELARLVYIFWQYMLIDMSWSCYKIWIYLILACNSKLIGTFAWGCSICTSFPISFFCWIFMSKLPSKFVLLTSFHFFLKKGLLLTATCLVIFFSITRQTHAHTPLNTSPNISSKRWNQPGAKLEKKIIGVTLHLPWCKCLILRTIY